MPPATVTTIKKRADFLHIGKAGKRFACPFFVVIALKNNISNNIQASESADEHVSCQRQETFTGTKQPIRIGYTVSKKVSKKAVTRNRIKRRLREAVRIIVPKYGYGGHDYVIIARRAAETAEIAELTERLQFALKWLHKQSK